MPAGAIHALIGPNGAGKTTIFNMIAGVFAPDAGTVSLDGKVDLRPAARPRLRRRRRPHLPAREAVQGAERAGERHGRRAASQGPSRRGARQRVGDPRRGSASHDRRHQLAESLTLPDRKRLEVARALATEPKLLLLDEVMAGLRPTEVDVMVAFLRELNGSTGLTILLIEHVMRAVMALAAEVVVVSYGEKIAEGTPQEIARHQAVLDVYLGEEEAP